MKNQRCIQNVNTVYEMRIEKMRLKKRTNKLLNASIAKFNSEN